MQTQLDPIYEHEKIRASRTWLTQPMGGGRVLDLSFAEAIGEARRVAAFLQKKGYPAGSRDEWTIDNGLLTPTMKLKRSAVESKYAAHAERWLAAAEAVIDS